MPDPLIVTLDLDDATARHFDDLRREHFPSARNVLPAHVTLFHALPGQREPDVSRLLAELARRDPFTVSVTGVRRFRRGVAYDLRADPVAGIHSRIQREFADDLTRQDAQKVKLHVTVANKLDPDAAEALFGDLEAGFTPFEATAAAVALHRYQGGPWQLVDRFAFQPFVRVSRS